MKIINKKDFLDFIKTPGVIYASGFVFIYGILLILRFNYIHLNFFPFNFLKSIYPDFMSSDDIKFNSSFVEWFGVMYGLLLPLILIKAWEQYETVEKDLDKELDAIRLLLEDFLLLPSSHVEEKKEFLGLLQKYTQHIKFNYQKEILSRNEEREEGDNILRSIRRKFGDLFYSTDSNKIPSPLLTQLLQQLDATIDTRGDRISSSTQRFFKNNIRLVAIVASFVWLIPFYFLDLSLGVFGDLLVFSLTLLIILILHIIEDLNEPFFKDWKLEKDALDKLIIEIEKTIQSLPKSQHTKFE